ncbi:MAG: hypothetical protein ACP5E3_11575, partial [Bacteroidales bacterium]
MKKKDLFIIFLISVLISISINPGIAQAPEKMSYQAIIRNSEGELLKNSSVGIRIQILYNSEFGEALYVENQSVQTNDNGLLSLIIGEGTVVSGDLSTIDWSDGPYYLKTETDPTGGTNYSISGATELLSVPYALYAQRGGEPGPQG